MREVVKTTVRRLRQEQTTAEALLWEKIRNRRLKGLKFYRQYPIEVEWFGEKRFFVADFFCFEQRLIVEIDGKIHEHQRERDAIRTEYLETKGYRVVRFTNDEVLNAIEWVLEKIGAVSYTHLTLPTIYSV